ncbi:MAG TPA: cobalamin-dependent protein [Vicinamibacterales bacterium]|nr:cobalamin-dependent protein [Vicinamibacterales bacterium]
MKRRVALIEFSIYDQFPLTSAYLHSYARADAAVAEAFEFVYYTTEVSRVQYDATLQTIRGLDARILCFSCYVWNMGLIRRLVRDLAGDRNVDKIILGGHQVTHHIEQYVRPTDGKIVVINGQGEIPFRATLQRLSDTGELEGIRGVSFYRDGELWNGGEAEMLTNLDEIPSPFLGGQFERMTHPITVFETNRGCPYKCSFCTWGGDTLKVTKFSTERIKEELLWIAKKSVLFVYLADANWGMLPRDIEISGHIARLKKDYGAPFMVYYAAAKNKPKGSVACIEQFHEGGVITSQALGIQSLNDHTLELIDRKNIKTQAFLQMFDDLKIRHIDSYCELIWPLPGETLETLKGGFDRLIDLGAQTTVMYPAILINNARLTTQVADHDMESIVSDDWKSELQLVKKTKYASRVDVDSGFWFYYTYFLLANCDLSKALLRCMTRTTGKRYSELISDFATYLRENATSSSYGSLIESIFQEEAHGSLMTIGRLATHLLHERRFDAQCDVTRFVVAQIPNDIIRVLAVSTLWVFSVPRLFSDTGDEDEKLVKLLDTVGRSQGQPLSDLVTVQRGADEVRLHVNDASGTWGDVVAFFAGDPVSGRIAQVQIRYPEIDGRYSARDQNRNYVYAHGMIQRLTHISAKVSPILADAPIGTSDLLQSA